MGAASSCDTMLPAKSHAITRPVNSNIMNDENVKILRWYTFFPHSRDWPLEWKIKRYIVEYRIELEHNAWRHKLVLLH